MNRIEHTTKDGDSIVIFDDLFDYSTRMLWFQALYNSSLTFGISYDSQLSDMLSTSGLGNHWPKYEWENFGLDRHEKWNEVQKELGDRSWQRAWLNVNTGIELFRYHADFNLHNAKSILYYPNLKWDQNWDGQTVFKSRDAKQFEYCIDYVPGRLVVFDSIIPHKAVHANHEAQGLRMIINAVFYKKETDNGTR